MSSAVSPSARWSARHRCPVCDGCDKDPRGEARRCFGFLSDDGLYAHCSRDEHAGGLAIHEGSMTYAHLLTGTCKCGQSHDNSTSLHTSILSNNVRTIAKVYDYEDAQGNVVHQTVRYEPKSFGQRRPDPEKPGAWLWNLQSITPVLYHLPALLAQPERTVFLVEGERDADSLVALGLLATCNPMGAGKWRPSYTEALAHRHVVIIPDADISGAKHAALVSAALEDHARSALTLNLPESDKPGIHIKDSTDWIAQGGTRDELETLVKKARADLRTSSRAFPDGITAAALGQINFPPPRELIPGVLYEGAALFGAPPKSGKSITMLGLAAGLATGGRALGTLKVDPCRVLYLSLEDPLELVQARLFTMLRSRHLPDQLEISHSCNPLRELPDQIEHYVTQEHPNTGLVVVDTLAHARGAAVRSSKNIVQEDYQDLIGFSHLANRLHISIVVVTHTAKANYEDELAQISGTFGLSGAVDSIMVLGRKRFTSDATLAIFSRRLGSEKKLELHWDQEILSYLLDGEMPQEQAARTSSSVIIECLQKSGSALGAREIAQMTGMDYDAARQRCFHLAKSGEIVNEDRGRYSAKIQRRNNRSNVTSPLVNTDSGVASARNNGHSTDNHESTDCYADCYDPGGDSEDGYQSKTDPDCYVATNVTRVQNPDVTIADDMEF